MFLLRSTPKTRIVSNNLQVSPVLHVGTFINGRFTMDNKIGIDMPTEHNFQTFEEMTEFVGNCNPMFLQGVIAFNSINGFYKVTSRIYNELFQLRGNEPNLKLRYLQLRLVASVDQVSSENLNAFCNLYYDSIDTFKEIEQNIVKIARNIHNIYIRRFIQKTFAVLPPVQYEILKKCHSEYIATKVPVTFEKVFSTLLKELPETLYKILNTKY